MATVTSSNGYKMRPLIESDQPFIMECLKDFPIGSNTYYQRITEFSHMLYVTEGYNADTVKAGNQCSLTAVLEKTDGTKLGFNHYEFDNKIVTIKMGVIHPTYRGEGHATANLMLGGALCYTELGCTGAVLELVDTYENQLERWRPDLTTPETTRTNENKFGDAQTYNLIKITAKATEHEAHRAAHSTWGSVTFTTE